MNLFRGTFELRAVDFTTLSDVFTFRTPCRANLLDLAAILPQGGEHMPTVKADRLEEIANRLLQAAGASE